MLILYFIFFDAITLIEWRNNMNLKDLIHILYIRGYCDNLPIFLNNLLKASVVDKEKISFSKANLDAFIRGESIDTLSIALEESKYSKTLLSVHIKSLYSLKHTDSKTFNNRFGDKTYKEALYDKIKDEFMDKFPDITIENMSELLANCFDVIYKKSINEIYNKKSRSLKMQNSNTSVENSYSLTDNEKQAIINICDKISQTLDTIRKSINKIESVRKDIEEFSNSEENQCLLEMREIQQASLENKLQTEYEKLESLCADAVEIIGSKIKLFDSFKKVYDIARYITGEHKWEIDGFVSTNNEELKKLCSAYTPHVLNLLISRFEGNYKAIQASINKF